MTYFVYKRSDGFVGVCNSSEKLAVDEKPECLRSRTIEDIRITYTVLLQTDDWDEAVLVLQHERGVIDAVIDAKPPVDPADVKRRVQDSIDAQLKSVRERMRHAHGEIAELHGLGHPAQSTLEIALVALNDTIRFNEKDGA